ncbi:sugar ABC transporter substrate-binding protein [Vallitalea okinawensis]|uniref:sugar ABC transporter substrate-binding protein n=1 Tax=Vallitalea okinawensis TaxID=2078660 RepID=UPI001A9A4435|nr:sugar ABC transporter substrate-binding protein [Vallitalea okinawensis]
MKKVVVMLLVITMLLGVGCQKEEAASTEEFKQLTIGFVVKGSDEHWIQVEKGARQAAKDFNVKLDFNGPAQETLVEEHTGMIENNITNNVDALCVAPVQPAAQAKVLQKAVDKNIPVLLIDTDAELPDKTSFLGTGNYEAAKLAGDYISEKLGAGKKVAIIRGALGDKTHDDRTAGAQDALEAAGLEVLDVQPADSDSEKAANVMENLMQTFTDIDAIFVTADQMALGALKAVEQSGKDIMVVGFDGSPGAQEKIKEGSMEGSVAQSPYQMGYLGVQNAIIAANGGEVDVRIDTGAELLTIENLK